MCAAEQVSAEGLPGEMDREREMRAEGRTGILEERLEVGFRDPLGVADFVRVDLVLRVERQEKDVVDCREVARGGGKPRQYAFLSAPSPESSASLSCSAQISSEGA